MFLHWVMMAPGKRVTSGESLQPSASWACAEHAAGEGEERADQLECSADDKADETEWKQDEPDEREENYGC